MNRAIVKLHKTNAGYLRRELEDISPISKTPKRSHATNSYYVQAFKWENDCGIHRDIYINAVKAELAPEEGRENEGVPIGCGYIKPLYLFPIFQKFENKKNYQKGSCPVAEELWENDLFFHRLLGMNINKEHLDDIIEAFWKVWLCRDELK